MDTLKQFNLAMAYIETKLDSVIDFTQVARRAGCSEHHFRRMFSFLAGMSLSEYIRRRRMSQAAIELSQSDVKVIDLALKYGYTSPDAFSRAFQEVHGVTPTETRSHGASLKGILPMTFQLTIRGGNEMKYRIVQKEAFHIVGIRRRLSLVHQGVNPEMAAMWRTLTEADIETLDALADTDPDGLLSATSNFTEGRDEGAMFDYIIGVATTHTHSDVWHVLPVPTSTWAVFTVRGAFPQALQDIWERIYAEWLPTSGYEFHNGPEIVWTAGEELPEQDYHNEIWIPVRRMTSCE
ncbi:MAG: AraC family transcriptional regulator [Chloroflexi bacterium AL-W]|nr:AraC family transcriptional regulator [Chloroflexi bacterium AL-N1]NOK69539.1 AraC family transcriptional regulator [Chloroflexi bacterium AL-N10]NOK77504.1 AraC family transcriptional regulator [Chloroflexi bacterium AL-N5]NOK84355.1 AraC family transcriptional regulator [Chloroflexi bacterium AL-W]NOK91479.1 AraC family transcriptional regulator [Chloroflexi bacterium AL-N15]